MHQLAAPVAVVQSPSHMADTMGMLHQNTAQVRVALSHPGASYS